MKTIIRILSILFILSFFFVQKDPRIKDHHTRFTEFLQYEQQSLKLLEKSDDEDKLLTGIQYAALQEYYKTVDPNALRVPSERLEKAYRATLKKKSANAFNADNYLIMDWQELDTDMGGRARALMWDPNDPEYKKVWSAGVTGGLWYREDIYNNNSRWQVVDDFWEGLAVGCISYDPVDPMIFYAGTGEGQTARIIYRESSGRGFGILKSINGGESWEVLESTRGFAYVTDIEVRDENGNGVIYAGVVSGRYKSEIIESNPGDGLYRSDNGGQTWTQVLPDVPGTDHSYAPSDIEITANGRIFVGTGISLDETGAGNVLYSDDGLNWTVYDDYVDIIKNQDFFNYAGRVMIMSAPSDGNIVYAFLTAAGGLFHSFKSPRGVFMIRSVDGGNNWSPVKTPSSDGNGGWAYIAWHALSSAINPENPDKLYAGGLDLHTSDDGSGSWHVISSWFNFTNSDPDLPDYVHADQHTIRFRPGSATDAIFSTDGGVFLSTNTDQPIPNFVEKNHGFNTLQYYTCAIHPEASKYFFLAGAQDNGTVVYRKRDASVTTRNNVSYGDGAYCFFDSDNPNLQLTSSQFNYVYSTNVGLQYGYMENEIYYNQGGIFINPMDYDSRKDILYCNTCDLFGNRYDSLMRMYYFEGRAGATTFAMNTGTRVPFSAIKVSPHTDGTTTVFTGTQDGKLYKVENADYLFQNPNRFVITEIGSPDLPAGNIACIDVGENNNQLLVIFSNYGVPSVWETRDGGTTWKNKESNLPDMPIRWGIYHPGNSNQVLLGTEIGIWGTVNISAEAVEWNPVQGFPNVRVDMIRVRESDLALVAATHGRGLWYSPHFPLYPEEGDKGFRKLIIYPNPASDFVRISTGVYQESGLDLYLYDLTGRQVLLIKNFIREGEFAASLSTNHLENGKYQIKLRNNSVSLTSSLLVIH